MDRLVSPGSAASCPPARRLSRSTGAISARRRRRLLPVISYDDRDDAAIVALDAPARRAERPSTSPTRQSAYSSRPPKTRCPGGSRFRIGRATRRSSTSIYSRSSGRPANVLPPAAGRCPGTPSSGGLRPFRPMRLRRVLAAGPASVEARVPRSSHARAGCRPAHRAARRARIAARPRAHQRRARAPAPRAQRRR